MNLNRRNVQVLMFETWSKGNDYALRLTEALREAGVKIGLVCVEDGQSGIYRGVSWRIVPTYDPATSKLVKVFRHLKMLTHVLFVFLRQRPDIVHFQSLRFIRFDWLIVEVFRLFKVKIVFTAHNTVNHEPGRFSQWVFDRMYTRSDLIFVLTRFSKNELLERLSIAPERVRIAPIGTVPLGYEMVADESSLAEPRKFWGIDEDAQVVLAFGLVREYKGLDLLFESLKMLEQEMPLLHLLAVGFCPYRKLKQRYERQVVEMGLSNRVHLRISDRIPDKYVGSLFRCADIVALPYRRIDQASVLVTALAHRRCVVASCVGGLAEQIEDGKNGFLFENGNARDLAEKLQLAFSDPLKLQQMNVNAFELARAKYVWSRAAEATIDGYKTILSSLSHR